MVPQLYQMFLKQYYQPSFASGFSLHNFNNRSTMLDLANQQKVSASLDSREEFPLQYHMLLNINTSNLREMVASDDYVKEVHEEIITSLLDFDEV
jgi:hypothetical protein